MKKLILLIVFLVIVAATLAPVLIYDHYRGLVYTDMVYAQKSDVAIVFGAGLKADGTPANVLRDRLRTAADLYKNGSVMKILVSGDNRYVEHNEPDAMALYLVEELGVPADAVVADYAGRRTYDTCARARDIWSIDKAILITQGYHLPRALFICNALGVSSTGLSATKQTYLGELSFKIREILAIDKAIFDVYLWPPEYVGGQVEQL